MGLWLFVEDRVRKGEGDGGKKEGRKIEKEKVVTFWGAEYNLHYSLRALGVL